MKHPQHDLLIAAANDVDAKFTYNNENEALPSNIVTVLTHSQYDWKLVDKFAELKKAYAEGNTIQVKTHKDWVDTVGEPQWIPNREYRIKPKPVYEWQWLCLAHDGRFYTSDFFTCPPKNVHSCIEDSKREVKP